MLRTLRNRVIAGVLTTGLVAGVITGLAAAPAHAAGITATITGFNNPQGMAVLPNGNAVYVADASNNAIKVIDTSTNTVTTTISLNGGSPAYTSPQGIAVSPDGAYIYVTANGPATPTGTTDGILKISTASNTVTSWSTPGLTTKSGLAINPAGTRLYAAQANNNSGTVRVIQMSDMTVVATISNLNNSSGCNGTGWIGGTAVSNDGTKLFVTCSGTGKVLVLNLSDNSVATVITGFTNPNGIAVASDGTIHVADQSTGVSTVSILDGTTYSVLSTVTGFNRPSAIALTPNNQYAYVSNANNTSNGGAAANSVTAVSRSYSVTYNTNSSTSGTAPTAGSYTTGGSAYSVSGNTGTLARTGYTFAGWNTLANGTGTDYAAGSSTYSSAASITLYAKWTGNTYHVTYDGNGSTGGAAPSAGTFTSGGTAYTVPSNGTLTKTGYTFAKWNTAANGSGTDFGPGTANTTYSTSADQLLYAQWTAGTYTITFDGNGSTGGTTPSAGSYTTGGTAFSVPANTGTLVKTGYTFSGWNTAANGTGTDYAAGSSTISPVTNTTLYAQWSANAPSGGGGGTDTTPTTTPSASKAPTSAFTLDPITHDANPRIPTSGAALGSSVLLTSIGASGSSTQSINVAFTVDAGRVQTPDFSLSLASRYARASDTPGTPGSLTLYSRVGSSGRSLPLATAADGEPTLDSAGTGFQPGSPIRVYLLPSTRLGELTADASGRFTGRLPVPGGLAPGAQTLQINGFAPDGSVRSLSVGVVVKTISAAPAVKQARTSVQFARGSAILSRSGRAHLAALVRRTGKSGAMSVVGFARGQKLTAGAKALSDARARAVASFLRTLGLKGTYAVRGVWVVGGPVSTGERVTVVVSYPAPRSNV